MGADTLLTLLGLVLAAYVLLPAEPALHFKLRLRILDWLVLYVAVILLLYIQFHPVLSTVGLALDLGTWQWGFDPENASLLIVLVATCFVVVRARLSRVGPHNIHTFRELIDRLLNAENYSETFRLLEENMPSVFGVYRKEFLLAKLRRKLIGDRFLWPIMKPSRAQIARRFIGERLIPSYEKPADAAADIVRRVLVYELSVSYLAKARPYLGCTVMRQSFRERDDFLNMYIRALLKDKHSILYHELRNNQNLASGRRYVIDDRNKLVSYLLRDVRIAESLAIWKPFGDFALEYLDSLHQSEGTDPYNLDIGTYVDEGKGKCPLYFVLWFFDAMILEALYQGIKWHMWLYYFPSITDRILRNLDPDPRTCDMSNEWPTPYHFLLYHIFGTLGGWIESAADQPEGQENVAVEAEDISRDNGSIPKSAVIALGDCLRSIMVNDKVHREFRSLLLSVVLRRYFDLWKNPRMHGLARVFLESMVKGGSEFERADDLKYILNFEESLQHVDLVPYLGAHLDELRHRVRQRIGEVQHR